jgi:prepilin-type processing-associated H-X9-DG protein
VGDAIHDLTTSNLVQGVLFPYNRSVGIYRCPANKTTVANSTVLRTRTYQLDGHLNFTQRGMPWALSVGGPNLQKYKVSQLVNPSPTSVLTFIDSHPFSGDTAEFINEFPPYFSAGLWIDLPGEQHNHGCSLAFADGHVEHWRWRGSRSTGGPVVNADDLSDLKHLAEVFPQP